MYQSIREKISAYPDDGLLRKTQFNYGVVEPKSAVREDYNYTVHESVPEVGDTKNTGTKTGTSGTKTGTIGTKTGTIGTKTGTIGTKKTGTSGTKTGISGTKKTDTSAISVTKTDTSGTKTGTDDGINGKARKTAAEKLLFVIRENEAITQKQMSDKTGLSLRTVKHMTAELQRTGKIVRIGNSRSGKWLVREK